MSIVATTSAPPLPGISDWITLLILGIPAVLVLWRAGVFRRGSVAGPTRVRAHDPLGLLLMALIGGAFLWIVIPALFVSPEQMKAAATAPASQPVIPPRTLILASAVSTMIAAVFMIVANFTFRPTGVRDLGLLPSGFGRGLVAALIGAIPSIWLVFVTIVTTQLIWHKIGYKHPREHDLLRLLQQSKEPATSALILFSALIAAPLFEELLFRGHLQTLLVHAIGRLKRRSSEPTVAEVLSPATRWTAIILASVLFTMVHPLWTWPPIFLLSLALGYAYERTGNLWVPILIHTAFNTTSTILHTLTAPS